MVLFIYIARLASNEKFKFNINNLTSQLIIILILTLVFILNFNSQVIKFNKEEFLEIIFKIYSFMIINLTIFTIFYLIFTLIVVVKIMSLKEGPLRTK